MSFDFEHTPERDAYLNERGQVVLSACPGSGKTTVLAYKLSTLIDEVQEKRGPYSGVLCISFTNTAKDEISEKYRKFTGETLSDPNKVLTINSFINTFVTLPFYKLIVENIRPRIIEDDEFDDIIRRHLQYRFKSISYKHNPSIFSYDENLKIITPYEPKFKDKQEQKLFSEYIIELRLIQFRKGLLKNSDSVVVASYILRKFPRLAKYLTQRFPYILIDEAQDTSKNQHDFFSLLRNEKLLGFEIVGDSYQSIYGWNGADPEIFVELTQDDDWIHCELNSCRRSCQNIIDVYGMIRSADLPQIISVQQVPPNSETPIPIHIILYKKGQLVQTVNFYSILSENYDNKRVLVRGKTHLSELGIQEKIKLPWKSEIPTELLAAHSDFLRGSTKNAVNKIRATIIKASNPELSYSERKILGIELSTDYNFNSRIFDFLSKFPSLELKLRGWVNSCEVAFAELVGTGESYPFELKQRGVKKFEPMSINEIFDSKSSTLPVDVSTIHKVKGMTFQSVCLILSENSSGQKISLNDLSPSKNPTENQRLTYVAMSRPEHQLILGVPFEDNIYEKIAQIFPSGISVHTLI